MHGRICSLKLGHSSTSSKGKLFFQGEPPTAEYNSQQHRQDAFSARRNIGKCDAPYTALKKIHIFHTVEHLVCFRSVSHPRSKRHKIQQNFHGTCMSTTRAIRSRSLARNAKDLIALNTSNFTGAKSNQTPNMHWRRMCCGLVPSIFSKAKHTGANSCMHSFSVL
jgi:hypothetical protein